MQKSVDINFEEMAKRQSEMRFQYMAEDFFKRYQPEDRDDAARFHAELFMLVREVYIAANSESNKLISSLLKCAVFPPLQVMQPDIPKK